MTDGPALARSWQEAIFATGRPPANGDDDTRTAFGLCSDAVLVHAPGVAPDQARGSIAIERLTRGLRDPFAIDSITVDSPILTDDRLAMRWTVRGVHVGSYLGIAPTGLRVEIDGVDVIRLTEGRVAEIWRSYDRLALVRRLRGAADSAADAG